MDAPIDAIQNVSKGSVTYFSGNSFPSNSNPSPTDVAIVFINSDSGENYITVEGNPGDRTTAGLYAWHDGDTLVQKTAAAYSTVIVVVHTVGPIIVENWIDLPSVKAVLFAHLPGQEAGQSLTNVLFGSVSPSGHLPYTIPKSESDYPSSLSLVSNVILVQPQDTYTEGLYIDYRYFQKYNITPRYPFGYGLSYTTFNFSSISVDALTSLTSNPPAPGAKADAPVYPSDIPPASEAYEPAGFHKVWRYLYSWLSKSDADAAAAAGQKNPNSYPYPPGYSTVQQSSFPSAGGGQGGNPALWDVMFNISVTITNTGTVAGKAVAQLYVQYPPDFGFDTPKLQLRDFAKTATLDPGQSEQVVMQITRKDASVWDVVSQNWVADAEGEYRFWVGESSDSFAAVCGSKSLTCQ
jgi:beta-glucosidase